MRKPEIVIMGLMSEEMKTIQEECRSLAHFRFRSITGKKVKLNIPPSDVYFIYSKLAKTLWQTKLQALYGKRIIRFSSGSLTELIKEIKIFVAAFNVQEK